MSKTQSPPSRESLARLVEQCTAGELRAVGSRTSKSPCYETQGSEISLPSFSHTERISGTRVRAGAGVILGDLLEFLRREKLALPTIGEWAGQTLAGAISTGSHGGSYKHGSLCSSVAKVVLVDGLGQERSFERGDADFDFLLPSFGTTGALIEFELECEPLFDLSLGRRCVDFGTYVEDLIDNPQHVEFRASIWLPAADKVIDYSANRVRVFPGGEKEREVRFSDTAMVFDWLSRQPTKWAERSALTQPAAMSQLSRLMSPSLSLLFPDKQYLGVYQDMLAPLKGTAAEILHKRKRNRTPPEGEFALPRSRARALLQELDLLFRVEGLAPDRPVGLRPGAAESGALAASQGEDCIWVSMFIAEDNPLMRVLPDILVQHQARPHWGKCVFHRPDDIPALYSRWQEFCDFRKTLDPRGVFINRFAEDFGIERPTA
jgi:L-gulonolactone oxidase